MKSCEFIQQLNLKCPPNHRTPGGNLQKFLGKFLRFKIVRFFLTFGPKILRL